MYILEGRNSSIKLIDVYLKQKSIDHSNKLEK